MTIGASAMLDRYGQSQEDMQMQAHFVEFLFPGTFVAESTVRPIDSWDVETAKAMALNVHERYGARPYGFRFFTKTRAEHELDSSVSARSNLYYLGGKVETIDEVRARALPDERILLSNMECNHYDKIVINTNSWRWTQPLHDGDVILDFAFPASEPVRP